MIWKSTSMSHPIDLTEISVQISYLDQHLFLFNHEFCPWTVRDADYCDLIIRRTRKEKWKWYNQPINHRSSKQMSENQPKYATNSLFLSSSQWTTSTWQTSLCLYAWMYELVSASTSLTVNLSASTWASTFTCVTQAWRYLRKRLWWATSGLHNPARRDGFGVAIQRQWFAVA